MQASDDDLNCVAMFVVGSFVNDIHSILMIFIAGIHTWSIFQRSRDPRFNVYYKFQLSISRAVLVAEWSKSQGLPSSV